MCMNTTQATNANELAASKLAQMSVATLAELFDLTEARQINVEVALVRGWIMDALEAKQPEAFAAWMDSYGMTAREAFKC